MRLGMMLEEDAAEGVTGYIKHHLTHLTVDVGQGGLMDTSLGKWKLPRCCPPGPGNVAWTGADDTEPTGWKTAAFPLPQATAPARMPAANNAADPRRPRMVPPWPPGSG